MPPAEMQGALRQYSVMKITLHEISKAFGGRDIFTNFSLDIESGRARLYIGNYTAFAEKKAELRKDMMKAYLNNQAEIKHQQEVIEKLRRFNREKSNMLFCVRHYI